MKRQKQKSRDFAWDSFVDIVADGSIAGPIAEGVNVPLLVLDTTTRADVAELIRLHQHLPPGDHEFVWATLRGDDDSVVLALDFRRPVETQLAICFSIERQGILVDAALRARALYLQAGQPGDRLIHDLDRPKLVVELPDTDFRNSWEKLLLERMSSVIARRSDISISAARPFAEEMVEQSRQVFGFRIPRV